MNIFANDILVIFQIRYCLVSIEGGTVRLLQKGKCCGYLHICTTNGTPFPYS